MTSLHHYYDRDGNPISFADYCALHTDPAYVLVAHTAGPNWEVMTTWLGMGTIGPPWGTSRLFQLVFVPPNGQATVVWFPTFAEALEGHASVVDSCLDVFDGELDTVAVFMEQFRERTFGA